MKKNQTCKILAIGIICLFVGVSVSSAISVDTKSTTSNNQSEECRECKEVSKSDLIRVERLLNKVEVYSKLLKVLSRHNPELREMSEELSKGITTLKDEFVDDPPFPIICDILDVMLDRITPKRISLEDTIDSLPEDSLLYTILNIICTVIETYIGTILMLEILFGCWDPYYPY